MFLPTYCFSFRIQCNRRKETCHLLPGTLVKRSDAIYAMECFLVLCVLTPSLCLSPSRSAWWNTPSLPRLGRNPASRSGGLRNLIWYQCQKTSMETSSREIPIWCWTPSSSGTGTSSTTCTSGWVSVLGAPAELGAQSQPWASPSRNQQDRQHSGTAVLGAYSVTLNIWNGFCNSEYSYLCT